MVAKGVVLLLSGGVWMAIVRDCLVVVRGCLNGCCKRVFCYCQGCLVGLVRGLMVTIALILYVFPFDLLSMTD